MCMRLLRTDHQEQLGLITVKEQGRNKQVEHTSEKCVCDEI